MFCHIRFKACRKCGGDLSLEEDIYGGYYQCIQCGSTCHEGDVVTRDKVAALRSAKQSPVVASQPVK